jgi:hypothetical protein
MLLVIAWIGRIAGAAGTQPRDEGTQPRDEGTQPRDEGTQPRDEGSTRRDEGLAVEEGLHDGAGAAGGAAVVLL